MPNKKKAPGELTQSKKTAVRATRGKNAAGQTNGQFERDPKGRTGNFTGAGDAPMMLKQKTN
ncbi:MAG TPA: hypothetical protein VHM16_03180 [Rubrobacteraceae bacterium]|nr:hypothetical protein [Rubrobacteraceae bacterium]